MATRNQLYDIALNGQGFILETKPETPQIHAEQNPIYNPRYAQGDRDYNDLANWWYLAQTDWSGGIKDTTSWADDAKYYYNTNIDTWSEVGAIKLLRELTLENTFSSPTDLFIGAELEINGTTAKYVGTDEDGSSKPVVYRYNGSSWVNITDTQMTSNQNIMAHLAARNGIGWFHSVGVGYSNVLLSWDGVTFTDHGNLISASALTWQFSSSRCGKTIGGTYYAGVDDFLNDRWAIVKTTEIGRAHV